VRFDFSSDVCLLGFDFGTTLPTLPNPSSARYAIPAGFEMTGGSSPFFRRSNL